ncbi:outer membrane beta-barrel protein [Sediminibacterium ginsengisoli]|uniref:CarboxypepD_reg-like domain-containing protein n=1 Tax=Sediminibacterium ginsengisoli TaxID=413434 RepID=A0A1T4LZ44_9BACT|nr:outer membrane beta-barrel protein [Sediminibacterium ginsengisoli]SJZ59932.1 CarboxypepD_reg-like domain-containing protein [Sediminibacterium ginsengisoli]
MSKFLPFLACILFSIASWGQNTGTVKGKLVDTVGKQSLKDATITILNGKDSTLEVFGLSKADGSFSVTNIDLEEMILQVKFQGYETVWRKLNFSKSNTTIDLGSVYMKTQDNDLGMVTVTQSPIQMKKDTVEFNASAFKTKPNAVAEDLLKKVPGIQVDKDGNIKAQGEQVQRILVDGKQFFGNDPKMATRNLPPDVIDKIQVFDALSDQSAFTGFDDGNRIKTINITTRKDKRKGYFGKAAVGFGAKDDEGLYDNSFNFSRFNGDQQITLIGQGNNVNKQNFSVQDMLGSLGGGNFGGGGGNFGGGGGRGGGGGGGMTMVSGLSGSGSGGGIVNTWAGGLNYRDNWGTKTQFYGSYFYNDQRTYRDQKRFDQYITNNPDSSRLSNSVQSSMTHNQNHRINMNIEHQFDSNNTLIIRPNISFQKTYSITEQMSEVSILNKGVTTKLSDVNMRNTRENSGYNASIDATFRHRFLKKGRTFSLNLNGGHNTNDGTGENLTITNNYSLNTKDTTNQIYSSNPETKNLSVTASYTEPIGKNQMIELNYNYSYNNNTSGKQTYAYNKATGKYDLPVGNLSNLFENDFTSNRATVSYRIQNAKVNFSVGSGIQVGDRKSHNLTKDSVLTQHYVNFFPTANLNYSFTKTKTLRIFYNGRPGQPSIDQLQPVTDNSNELNVKMGNPDLKQQFTHSIRLLFNSFDMFTQRLIFASVNASFVQDDIQNATFSLPNGGQLTKPVNLGGTYNINGFVNYGFPIKSPKSNLNLRAVAALSQSQGLVDNRSNYTRNTSLGGEVAWTTNLKDNFDMNFTYAPSFNMARYTLNPKQNTNYASHLISTDATYYTHSGWVLATDFDYTINTGRGEGYDLNIFLWNASLSKQILKNKAGEIKFSVFDLLKQNKSITTTASANSFSNVQNKVLSRYFMVTFTYNLRRFGAQGQQQRGGDQQRMPNMMRMGGQGGGQMRMGGNGGGRGGFE